MSSSEQIYISPQDDLKNELINDLSSHKFNLFQQFFVIGLDPSICYNLYKLDITILDPEFLIPKVISKYPNTSLPYINIPDSFVASHCFPKGILGLLNKLKEYNNEELNEKSQIKEVFSFSLDNLVVQDYTSSLRTNKVYYNCLLFYEKLKNFKNLANYRSKISFKSQEILEEEKNKNILIPKVICLSTFTPLFMSGFEILTKIKKYYKKYNLDTLSMPNKNNIYPIENIIEGIIYNIPGLPRRGKFSIRLNYGSFFYKESIERAKRKSTASKNNINNKKKEIIFEQTPINQNPQSLILYSKLMTFFTIGELFDIIKNIILEEPILFFSDDISNLTHTIEGLLTLIYPLSYQYPVVSVLPEENFSLISVFYHFIFGINYKYSEKLWEEKFKYIGDKSKIVIIPIESRFPNFLDEIDKDKSTDSIIITKYQKPDEPIVLLAKLASYKNKQKKENPEKKIIKLPIHYCAKCTKRLGPLIKTKIREEKIKKNRELLLEEMDEILNKEIINNFLYFFTCILLTYQDYIKIRYEKPKAPNQGKDNTEIYKIPDNIKEKLLNNELDINYIFNINSFINNASSFDILFYEKFFRTKIFYNFIKKKILPMSVLDKLEVLFFDEKINEKLARETKFKKIETKFLEEKFENISGEIRIDSIKQEISEETKEFLCNEYNCDKALNYFQYIVKQPLEKGDENNQEMINPDVTKEKRLPNFKFYYFVFPKLLNDGIFYQNRKKEINKGKENKIFNNDYFYNIFEKEGKSIIMNPIMTANYKTYNYSWNTESNNNPGKTCEYVKAIKQLWLRLLSKTFYCIPNNKKLFYFSQINKFLDENIKTIDEESLYIVCNIINKYGDKYMNKEFFRQFFRRNKTYISFLLLIEKLKEKNNFIDYRSCAEKKIKLKDLKEHFTFIINSFCTNLDRDEKGQTLYHICGETTTQTLDSMFNKDDKYICFECEKELKKLSNNEDSSTSDLYEKEVGSMYDESDKYISFEYQKKLNKISTKQALIISCFYRNEEETQYQVNFKLISPTYILQQNWFKNVDNININSMKKEHLESYLSSIFYFHQQGLIYDFLLIDESPKRDLIIEKGINDINLNAKKINKEKEEEQKECEIKIEKKEDVKNDIIMSANDGLDLGGLDLEFYEPPPEIESKTESPNKNPAKKKVKNTVTVAEFKLNNDETK